MWKQRNEIDEVNVVAPISKVPYCILYSSKCVLQLNVDFVLQLRCVQDCRSAEIDEIKTHSIRIHDVKINLFAFNLVCLAPRDSGLVHAEEVIHKI